MWAGDDFCHGWHVPKPCDALDVVMRVECDHSQGREVEIPEGYVGLISGKLVQESVLTALGWKRAAAEHLDTASIRASCDALDEYRAESTGWRAAAEHRAALLAQAQARVNKAYDVSQQWPDGPHRQQMFHALTEDSP